VNKLNIEYNYSCSHHSEVNQQERHSTKQRHVGFLPMLGQLSLVSRQVAKSSGVKAGISSLCTVWYHKACELTYRWEMVANAISGGYILYATGCHL